MKRSKITLPYQLKKKVPKEQISVRIKPDNMAILRKLAKKHTIAIGDLINVAIDEYLKAIGELKE